MLKVAPPNAGDHGMAQTRAGLARDIALSLVDELTAYQEELIVLERETPSIAPLRQAVGLAIADAWGVLAEDAPRAARTARAH
jgi:hypothetical protein